MNYKGIDKEKILEVQKVKLHNTDAYAMFTEKELENLCKNTDAFERLHDQIELQHKARKNDTEMAIICEMAMMYLDSLKDKETADKEAYNKGLNDAWECANKLNNMVMQDIINIYGFCLGRDEVFVVMTPQEAIAKLEAYEKEQAEIKVGDVVEVQGHLQKCVVTQAILYNLELVDSCGNTFRANKDEVKKTGKHIDIQKILDELKEGNDNA